MTRPRTMLVDDPLLERSPFGTSHPFRAERGALTRALLEACGALHQDEVAGVERLDERLLGAVHEQTYVEALVLAGRGEHVEDARAFGLGTIDCPIVPGKSVRPLWWTLTVSTSARSQKMLCTPSPWWTSTST